MNDLSEGNPMEEYLTVDELSARIKFSKQSLYNLIHKGILVLGRHYLKPTPKKVLFKWSEIQIWMGEALISTKQAHPEDAEEPTTTCNLHNSFKNKPLSAINI